METLLVFAVAEVALMSTLTTLQVQAQEKLVQRWKQGSLTLEELKILKTRRWFQRRVLKPPKEKISSRKKND